MRKTCIAIIAILLPAAALAQQGDRRNFQTPPDASKTLPSKSATRSNPCASYGPGFVKVEDHARVEFRVNLAQAG